MEPHPNGWTAVIAEGELAEGKPVRVRAGGNVVLLVRAGDRIFALDNRCSHQGGPLHRGVAHPSKTLPTVTCPIHGSLFGLADGRVLRGPAMDPQPVFDTRVVRGVVQVRRRT